MISTEMGPLAEAPICSVVISVKNRSGMLLDCMRGLAAQSIGLDRFEVVVVDNCSSENLSLIVAQAQTMGLDIRMVRTQIDRGPAPARNLGVASSRGAIIAFTDSDCRPTPDWLGAALPHFDHPDVALVTGPIQPKPEQRAEFTTRITFISNTEHPTFPTANILIRRCVFDQFGGFDPGLSFTDFFDRATECADTDLAWRIIKSGYDRRFETRALMHHELERQTVLLWVIDPSRLFVLPELIRRHPELRAALLKWGLLFYPPAAALYVAVPFAILAAWIQPLLLLALPVLLILRGVQKYRSVNPVRIATFSLRTLAFLPRMLIMNMALIYGSIRFRSLVL
jgi:glycosyltransferase involved in cell wall biosynthesis